MLGSQIRRSNNLENKILSDILKVLASMYESSGSQFFRTTAGIQSRPDAFNKSVLVMTFLTNKEVRMICHFRLDLEGKAGKEIPESSRLEFLEEFSANSFALSNAEGNTSVSLNRGGIQIYTRSHGSQVSEKCKTLVLSA